MVVKYMINNDQLYAEQTTNRPSVYLDQWMWSELSRTDDLKDRFIVAGQSVNCTIMYSTYTLYEMGKLADIKQLDNIKEIMDSFDYGFLDVNPTEVIAREDNVTYRANPAADSEYILEFAKISNPLKSFKISEILTKLISDTLTMGHASYKDLVERFDANLTPKIDKARNDEKVLRKVKNKNNLKKLIKKTPPYTRDLMKLAINFIVADQNMKMNSNEWVDFFNTVVPVSYCDFVLLDKRWCSFVRNNVPLKYPYIANVYKPSEKERFLKELTLFKADPNNTIMI